MPGFGFATTATSDDELGIWQPLPVVLPRDLGLEGVAAAPPENISLWEVSLPQDRREAGEVLALAGARLQAAEAALPYASQRLAVFRATGGVPVAVPRGIETPEEALAEWVAASEAGRELPDLHGPVEQAAAFFAKISDTVRDYAAIDTAVAGRRTGLTLVSWTGDFRTAWPRGLAADEAARHAAAVNLTLRTRDAWLRLGLTVAQGALQVAALFGASPALALPAAYRFVRQVIDQVQALGGLPALA